MGNIFIRNILNFIIINISKEYLMEVRVLCVFSISVISIGGLFVHLRNLKGHLC